eukprot:g32059.t1
MHNVSPAFFATRYRVSGRLIGLKQLSPGPRDYEFGLWLWINGYGLLLWANDMVTSTRATNTSLSMVTRECLSRTRERQDKAVKDQGVQHERK